MRKGFAFGSGAIRCRLLAVAVEAGVQEVSRGTIQGPEGILRVAGASLTLLPESDFFQAAAGLTGKIPGVVIEIDVFLARSSQALKSRSLQVRRLHSPSS